jgi:hypothetical protein
MAFPQVPESDRLILWETSIRALSVRQMPASSNMDWVALLPGPNPLTHKQVSKFWAVDAAVPSTSTIPLEKPDSSAPKFMAQSAGWIGSRREILELHQLLCRGGFLPPFDGQDMPKDGLTHNVEFWSGGIQMWCNFCNIQRIIPLIPEEFSKHLLYHTTK